MRTVLVSVTVFLALASVSFAAGGDRLLETALKHYNSAQYGKAAECFRLAAELGVEDKEKEFLKYATAKMEEYEAPFNDIEKEEALFSKDGSQAGLAASLYKKHYELAIGLMRGPFFLAMVEPHFKRMIELEPAGAAAYMDLGAAYYSAMRYDKAIECYEKAIGIDGGSLSAHRMAGDACVALGDFDAAKKHYSDLIDADMKAVLKYDARELEKVKRLLKILPRTYKDIDLMLGEERLDEAEELLKKRISLNRADYIALTELGMVYQEKGDRKNALRLLKEAARIAPDYPVSHLYLGRSYFLERKYDDALSELSLFRQNMLLLPKMSDDTKKMYIDALYYMIEVYFTLEMADEARSRIEEILKMDPEDQHAHYAIGYYYYKFEHSRSKAYQSFKKVVEMDPTSDAAKRAKYAIEFMRNNPDSRFVSDFSFIDQEYRD